MVPLRFLPVVPETQVPPPGRSPAGLRTMRAP